MQADIPALTAQSACKTGRHGRLCGLWALKGRAKPTAMRRALLGLFCGSDGECANAWRLALQALWPPKGTAQPAALRRALLGLFWLGWGVCARIAVGCANSLGAQRGCQTNRLAFAHFSWGLCENKAADFAASLGWAKVYCKHVWMPVYLGTPVSRNACPYLGLPEYMGMHPYLLGDLSI